MKIVLKPFHGKVFLNNRTFRVDNGDNIFFGFDKRLQKLGIDINTIDIGDKKVDRIIYCDVPYPWEYKNWFTIFRNLGKNVLICFESPLVNPFSHRRIFFKFFKHVYTWNDRLVDGRKVRKFILPNKNQYKINEVAFGKKKFLCLINSNKSIPVIFKILSPFKIDLYSKRKEAISYFEENNPLDFDLYGFGWEKVDHPSYRGIVERNIQKKISVLSKYKFVLCFENAIADGYISEKIIDCFKAHTIPIYLGAPNITKYIPKNCFIDFRDFKNYSELVTFLSKMNETLYKSYVKNAVKLMESKEFKSGWFEDGFEKTFLEATSN